MCPAIVAVGMVTMDLVSELETHPVPDSTNRAKDQRVALGGPAGRAALTAHRLGGDVTLIAMIGSDSFAPALRGLVETEGLPVHWHEAQGATQLSSILAVRDGGTRTTIWSPAPPASEMMLREIETLAPTADVVVVDCSDERVVRAVRHARAGRLTVVDTGSLKEHVLPHLVGFSHLVVPKNFLDSWVQRYAPSHLGLSLEDRLAVASSYFRAGVFVVTDGEAGGAAWVDGKLVRYRAVPVETVDSNGAGDTFHGALAWALQAGLDLVTALKIAAWTAAQKCSGLGNDSLPDAVDAQRAFRQFRPSGRTNS